MDQGALVHEAHDDLVKKIRGTEHVAHDAPVLALDGELRQAQSRLFGAVGGGDGLAQKLHGRAGKQHGKAACGRLAQGVAPGAQLLQGVVRGALGAGAQEQKVVVREGGRSLAGTQGVRGHRAAQGLQIPAQHGEVGVAAVQTHQVRIDVQDLHFHAHASFFTHGRSSSLSRSEKQVTTNSSSLPWAARSSAALRMSGSTVSFSGAIAVKDRRSARSAQ